MANPQAEPSMDEILASIRRIISEENATEEDRTPVREKLDTLELTQNEELSTDEPTAPSAKKSADDGSENEVGEGDASDADDQKAAVDAGEERKPRLRKKKVQDVISAQEQAEQAEQAEIAKAAAAAAAKAAAVEAEMAAQAEAIDPAVVAEVVDEAVDESEVETEPETFTEPVAKAAPEVAAAVQERTGRVEPEVVNVPGSGRGELHISETTTEVAASAFEALSENIKIAEGEGKTLEDLVQSMLQPLLVQWLDQNLPRIVEDKVEEEVRRLSRRR